MDTKEPFIIWFKDLTIKDVPHVGGKNAALGEMVRQLIPLGVNVPDGFAVTAEAYRYFLESAGLRERIDAVVNALDVHDVEDLQKKGQEIRTMILSEELPDDLQNEIASAYAKMEERYGQNVDVAVRSSATAEDLPGASFAGQQETYLNVVGADDVVLHAKKCIASLFTNRAISYRHDKGFSHMDAALSVGVQKMVRSDLATSGVLFSIDTETGFEKVVMINASYGLGEMVVQGKVTPDEYTVFKPALEKGFPAIIAKDIGAKDVKMVYPPRDGQVARGGEVVPVPEEDRNRYCMADDEIDTLAKWAIVIEKHFSEHHGRYQPMDIEWAKDGQTNELFIVQARPETVHSIEDANVHREYNLKEKGEKLAEGIAVGTKIATGKVRVIRDVKEIGQFQKGEVLVTEITDPDWEPIMKIASAIITDKGGRTSHAAIVSRELGISCIVGTENATSALQTGQMITVDCSSGKRGVVYDGELAFDVEEHRLDEIPETETKVMVNIGAPDEAFKHHKLPVKGVGLGRLEFIISSHIRIHPNALLQFTELKNSSEPQKQEVAKKIEEWTRGYDDKSQFYIDELAEGIGKIGAAFHPHEVIIRFSDFKTNEYRTLVGGELFEPEEANPMIGWRGASRYYDEKFKDAFGLECKAIKKVREEMGLENVIVMVPFCRTIEEGEKTIAVMKEYGLDRDTDKTFKVYVMCEVPSNVILIDQFLELFDGMSIGSNDLTQLTLGLDRDSGIIADIGNENDPAVRKLIADVVGACRTCGKYVGICGQGPSDFPEFAEFLVEHGIQSISLSPDTVIKTLPRIAEKEKSR